MSYIRLRSSLTSTTDGQSLKVRVVCFNKGDEPAYNVRAEIKTDGKTFLAEKKEKVPVNGVYSAEIKIPLALKKPGTYPLQLTAHYTDANQYPFSALTCLNFIYKQSAPAPFRAQSSPTSFSKAGKISFKAKNLSDREIKINNTLFIPQELSVKEKNLPLILPAGAEKEGNFNIKNLAALGGSNYQVFIISETEDQAFHCTQVTPSNIKITSNQEIFGLSYQTLTLILGILILFFILSQFIKWKS